jgi:hypothetical protein
MVTNTLMTGTLFWCWCVHGTWVADGTHQTLMQSSLSIKPMSHYSMKACILALEETVVKCMQPGGESLRHISVCCKLLVSHFLLKDSKDIEITRSHTVNVWLVMVVQAEGYGPPSLQSWPHAHWFLHIWTIWLEIWHQFLQHWDTSLGAMVGQKFKLPLVSKVRSDMYHPVSRCHVRIKVRIKF